MINKFKDFVGKLRGRPKTLRPPGISLPKTQAWAQQWRQKIAGLKPTASSTRNSRWSNLTEKLLAKEALTGLHHGFLATLLLVGTYSVGKIIALTVRGRPQFPPVASSRSNGARTAFNPFSMNQIKTSDPFKTSGSQSGPRQLADNKCDETTNRSSLPIKLINTVVLQDAVKSIAAVQLRSDRDLKEVREGDTLEGMAKVSHINRLALIIKNLQTGACELISDEKETEKNSIEIMNPANAAAFKQQRKIKGIENVGNKFAISRELLDEKLKDINAVLTQARAIKIQNADGTIAFKITEIEPGGIFAYLGIQDQDIITSINGKPITDLNEVMGLFGRIKNLDQLQLGLRREGDDTQLDYSIKK